MNTKEEEHKNTKNTKDNIEKRERVKGIIQKVDNKPWKDIFLWKITIEGKEYGYFNGEFPYKEGDTIELEYVLKNGYLNVKEIIDFNRTTTIPSDKDMNDLKYLFLMDDRMMKVTLLKCSVDLCLRKGEFSDAEIKGQYERFINLLDIKLI